MAVRKVTKRRISAKKSTTKKRKSTKKSTKTSKKIRGFVAKDAKALLGEIKKSPYKVTAISMCEGNYVCTASGTVFNFGDRKRLLFVGLTICPNNATVSDGSLWRYNGGCVC